MKRRPLEISAVVLNRVSPDERMIMRSFTPPKALCTIAICQLVAQEGLSLDVSSGGEYHTALKAGVPTERIFFHGNNKTRTELEYALDNGIGHVVIDSLQELELLEGLAEKRGVIQRVLL